MARLYISRPTCSAVLLFVALAFPAVSHGQAPELRVSAHIDGRSRLVVTAVGLHWHHLDFAAPGRELFTSLPTLVNGVEWQPVWPDQPDAENRGCYCDSSSYGPIPPVVQRNRHLELHVTRARGPVRVVRQPSTSDPTLVIEFDDNPWSGSDVYEVTLTPQRGSDDVITHQFTAIVPGTANPWEGDAPVFPLGYLSYDRLITFTRPVEGSVSCCGTAEFGPADGSPGIPGAAVGTYLAPLNGMSGIKHGERKLFLVGVFEGLPPCDSQPPPPTLPFATTSGNAVFDRFNRWLFGTIQTDFTELSPELCQPFFIGDGFTGDDLLGGPPGIRQTFHVPSDALTVRFGVPDGVNFGSGWDGTPSPAIPGSYDDNLGQFSVQVELKGTKKRQRTREEERELQRIKQLVACDPNDPAGRVVAPSCEELESRGFPYLTAVESCLVLGGTPSGAEAFSRVCVENDSAGLHRVCRNRGSFVGSANTCGCCDAGEVDTRSQAVP